MALSVPSFTWWPEFDSQLLIMCSNLIKFTGLERAIWMRDGIATPVSLQLSGCRAVQTRGLLQGGPAFFLTSPLMRAAAEEGRWKGTILLNAVVAKALRETVVVCSLWSSRFCSLLHCRSTQHIN